MGDELPPPLPPKQRASNGNRNVFRSYTTDDAIRALKDEEEAFKFSNRQRDQSRQTNGVEASSSSVLPLQKSSSVNYSSLLQVKSIKNNQSRSLEKINNSDKDEDLISFENSNRTNNDILQLYNYNTAVVSHPTQNRNLGRYASLNAPTNINNSLQMSRVAPLNANLNSTPGATCLNYNNTSALMPNNHHQILSNAFSMPNSSTNLQMRNSLRNVNNTYESASDSHSNSFNWSGSYLPNQNKLSFCSGAARNDITTHTYTPNIPFTNTANVPQQTGGKIESASAVNSLTPAPSSDRKVRDTHKDLIDLEFGGSSSKANKDVEIDNLLSYFDPLSFQKNKSPVKSVSLSKRHVDTPLSSEATAMLSVKAASSVAASDAASSYYEQVDPFEYMRSTGSVKSDPLLDAYDGLMSPSSVAGDTFDIPPPLPPRPSESEDGVTLRNQPKRSTPSLQKRTNTIVDGKYGGGVVPIQRSDRLKADTEAQDFWTTIKLIRENYSSNDKHGNPGLLYSSCLDHLIHPNLSVKLQIFHFDKDPVHFTSALNTSVDHVICQALVSLDLEQGSDEYFLKVRGIEEYLWSNSVLGKSTYVQSCVKYDNDVLLTLVSDEMVKKPYLRTSQDDERLQSVTVENLMSAGASDSLHYHKLAIALEQFEEELQKLHKSAMMLLDGTPIQELPSVVRSSAVIQVMKQICAIAGDVISCDIISSITFLVETCRSIQKSQGILDGEEAPQELSSCGGYMITGSDNYDIPQIKAQLLDAMSRLSGSLTSFLRMYANAFRVDFTVSPLDDRIRETVLSNKVYDKVTVKVCGLHRLLSTWRYDQYFVEAQLYHGSRCVGTAEPSFTAKPTLALRSYSYVPFDESLNLGARVNILPLESRVVLTVFGLRQLAQTENEGVRYIREEIGWTAVQCFSYDRKLTQGGHFLTLWPSASDRRLSPAPHSSDHPLSHSCPILCVEFTDFGNEVKFPEIVVNPAKLLNFNDLDINTQQLLKDIVERDIFSFNKSGADEREILWEKRHYLHHDPHALAKVLLAAHSWDQSCLPDLHSMVLNWAPPNPPDALHLLLPSFADTVVRSKAVEWLRGLGSDQLLTYLPQLVQAMKHEAWDNNSVSRMLLERAITCPRLAHHLYWLLNQCLPQQTSMSGVKDLVQDCRYRRRLQLVTKALLVVCGSNLENRLLTQEALLRSLYETAMHIKDVKDSQRLPILRKELENVNDMLKACQTSLPLSPALVISGVDVQSCNYFNSFTTPLKLVFHSAESKASHINAIFKVGDDLRQDMLVIQMIRLMDKLWLQSGLDLKIVTFNVVPTGENIGIIELVKEAETLRKIQTEYGVTGVFQDRPIAEWLAKQNPSALEYQRAVDNFTASCAGYCVATYILGICDRHNDNIMLKTTGHIFHIDFGKFLGDAQKFINFKRDRTPFVLTADMAFVINGGDKTSDKFHVFVDLCCQAFNIIRNNGHLLLYLFALMASSGISGVSWKAVMFVQEALLQDCSEQEAAASFARMIMESLHSKFTQVNFFIHNLAQMRFKNDPNDSNNADSSALLLSFIPHTYTMQEEGKIESVTVYSYQKRYNPNKFYVYILRVDRKHQKEPSFLFRSYKEFSEFHQKLCVLFPFAPFHSLPKGVQIGRSEVKSVAERRKLDIELFLGTLLSCDENISHSDVVYTFLHPLLRDQQDADIHIAKLRSGGPEFGLAQIREGQPVGRGQIKVSIQYIRGQLLVMVQHARNLMLLSNSQPSPYAKLYLLPDPLKKTKRKTRVMKKTCHPTFMEQITYRMSLEKVQEKTLEIGLWSEDRFSENSYLGSCYLPLVEVKHGNEVCEWLSLENNIRTARSHDL